jgi:hypothetical protein
MKDKIYLIILFIGFSFMSFSQNQEQEYKPNGKPVIQLFSDFRTTFNNGKNSSAFEAQRAYLGYEYNLSNTWNGKIVFDIADPGVGKLQMTAMLKNAYIRYKTSKITVWVGMISTTQFKASEDIWGNRYIEKSFQDAYKFNSSADLGFNIEYKPVDFVSVDFSLINGEGYKKLESDSLLRPGIGLSLKPAPKVTARIYADSYGKKIKQQSIATLLGYQGKNLSTAVEYNFQKNFGMADSKNLAGISVFANYKVSSKAKLFARFDHLASNSLAGKTDRWNNTNDGSLILAGAEIAPVIGVKIAPNLRLWNPAASSLKNITSFYLNCEFKF